MQLRRPLSTLSIWLVWSFLLPNHSRLKIEPILTQPIDPSRVLWEPFQGSLDRSRVAGWRSTLRTYSSGSSRRSAEKYSGNSSSCGLGLTKSASDPLLSFSQLSCHLKYVKVISLDCFRSFGMTTTAKGMRRKCGQCSSPHPVISTMILQLCLHHAFRLHDLWENVITHLS